MHEIFNAIIDRSFTGQDAPVPDVRLVPCSSYEEALQVLREDSEAFTGEPYLWRGHIERAFVMNDEAREAESLRVEWVDALFTQQKEDIEASRPLI